jgi:hypothetical protein
MTNEMTFIEKFGALIIALVALIQPWIIYLWKKLIKPGKVDFFETGNIEIGFGSFASTIGINGTLRSLDKDFYISSINLELTKIKDSSRHKFDWAVFRDTKLSISDDKTTDLELPYGFLLTTKSPQRVNIQFHDRKQQEDIKPIFDNLSINWQDFLNDRLPYDKRRLLPNPENEVYKIFEEFTKTPVNTDAFTRINREFYWGKGDYCLQMKINTSVPDKIFEKDYKFTMTEEGLKLLSYNILTLQDLACNQSRFNWNFAFANFKK